MQYKFHAIAFIFPFMRSYKLGAIARGFHTTTVTVLPFNV